MLHSGHLACFAEAMSQGNTMLVAVNSDASLATLGRDSQQNEEQRLAVVRAVIAQWPAFAVLFDEPTPIKLIEAIRPDTIVKGGDYAGQEIVGADFVRSYGGRVHFTPFVEGLSATRLLAEEAELVCGSCGWPMKVHEKRPAE